MFWILIFGIFISIVIFLKISFSIEFLRVENDDRAIFTISMIRDVIKWDIPFIDKDKKKGLAGIRFSKKDKKEDQKVEESFLSFSKMKDKFIDLYSKIHIFKDIINPIRKYIKNRLTCGKFVLNIEYSLGDASVTAISSGLLWGVLYNIIAFIDQNMILKEHDIQVNPTFNESNLSIKLYCIFSIRIVHIIIMFFISLYAILKYIIKNYILSYEMHITPKNIKL